MSKLFKLKEWLLVADAARHLAIVFGEDVTEADVLRLALDGKLQLSVNFVNLAKGKLGDVVDFDNVEWGEFSGEMTKAFLQLPEEQRGKPLRYVRSIKIDDKRFLNLSEEVTTVRGVWDLPMIGNERQDIEHEYQQLTGGPAITLGSFDGTFVEGTNGQICQLQEKFDRADFQDAFSVLLEALNQEIAAKGIEEEEAEVLRTKLKEDCEKSLKSRRSTPKLDKYYPAGGLPTDGVLVVRTSVLADFLQSINDAPPKEEKPLGTTERGYLLKMVIGMAVRGYSHNPATSKNSAPKEIADDLTALGMSITDDTVRKYLKEAANTVLPTAPR